jgi:hypothetical protein
MKCCGEYRDTPFCPMCGRRLVERTSPHMTLDEMPLWRLLVALDDAERVAGPDSQTARVLSRVVRERLGGEPPKRG